MEPSRPSVSKQAFFSIIDPPQVSDWDWVPDSIISGALGRKKLRKYYGRRGLEAIERSLGIHLAVLTGNPDICRLFEILRFTSPIWHDHPDK